MTIQARDFDFSDARERAITETLGAEGVVIWSNDRQTGVKQRELVAVVAGADGPDIVCATAWQTTFREEIITRIRFKENAERSLAKHLSMDSVPAIQPLLPERDPYDAAVQSLFDGRVHSLWRDADTNAAAYLLRVTGSDGTKSLAITTVERTETAYKLDIRLHVHLSEFRDWCREEFGVYPTAIRP